MKESTTQDLEANQFGIEQKSKIIYVKPIIQKIIIHKVEVLLLDTCHALMLLVSVYYS